MQPQLSWLAFLQSFLSYTLSISIRLWRTHLKALLNISMTSSGLQFLVAYNLRRLSSAAINHTKLADSSYTFVSKSIPTYFESVKNIPDKRMSDVFNEQGVCATVVESMGQQARYDCLSTSVSGEDFNFMDGMKIYFLEAANLENLIQDPSTNMTTIVNYMKSSSFFRLDRIVTYQTIALRAEAISYIGLILGDIDRFKLVSWTLLSLYSLLLLIYLLGINQFWVGQSYSTVEESPRPFSSAQRRGHQ